MNPELEILNCEKMDLLVNLGIAKPKSSNESSYAYELDAGGPHSGNVEPAYIPPKEARPGIHPHDEEVLLATQRRPRRDKGKPRGLQKNPRKKHQ